VSQISHFIPLHPKSEGQKAAIIPRLFFPPLNKVDRKDASLSQFSLIPESFPFGTTHDSDKILIPEPPLAGSGGSILKLHEDVQTCGYRDVQVMFEILTSELEVASHGPKHHQRKRPAWTPPPPWPSHRSSSMIAAAQ